jgi:hypothetical protein
MAVQNTIKVMQKTQIEAIKAEVLTLRQQMIELSIKATNLIALIESEEEQKPEQFNPLNPDLISEWVEYNGSNFDSDIEEIMDCSLDVNHYSSQVEVTIEKEINDYNRDGLLADAITKYLEWVTEEKNNSQEGDTNND